jgi:hypothetical protein
LESAKELFNAGILGKYRFVFHFGCSTQFWGSSQYFKVCFFIDFA